MRNKNKYELQLFYCETLSIEHVCTTKKNICTLVIIGQRDITSLNAISELLQLQELWIVESNIKEVPCFKENCQLEKLYLYSNKIENIPHLSNCLHLKTLFLSGNNIRDFRNLYKLTWLQELNLANNKLNRITRDFSKKSRLEYLNLAGNDLCFIKDIKNLAILPKLKSLVFSDPLYGECPLTSLFKYRFHIINCLPHLKILDYYSICESETHWSNHFFKNQVMYYNVKLHTQLNINLELLRDKHKQYQSCMLNIKQQLHALKMEERDNQINLKNKNCNEFENLVLKVKSNDRELSEWKEMLNEELKISRKQLIFSINFAGNINFIEYNENVGNTIIQICQQILEDSLCSVIKSDTGVKGVKLFKVVKVINNKANNFNMSHNRKCDSKLNMDNITLKILVSPCGVTNIKRWPLEFFEIALFEKQEIILSDCLALADNEWLSKTFLVQQNMNVLEKLSICQKRRICVLVQAPIIMPAKTVHNTDKCHTRCGSYQKDKNITCQKITLTNWKIADPIFVIEYEYILHEIKHKDTQIDDSENANMTISRSRNNNQHEFLSETNIVRYINANNEQLCNLVKLSISNQNIMAIDENLDLPNLREFDISYNQLLTFPNPKFIKTIRVLNVSFNKIQSLRVMEILSELEELDISWNSLANCVSSFQVLTAFIPNILKLNVYNNLFQDVIDNEMIESLSQFYLPKLQFINNNERKEYSPVSNDYFPCALRMCKFNNKQHINLLNSSKEILTKNAEEILIGKEKGQHKKCIHISHNSLPVSTILKKSLEIQELCATCSFLTEIPIVIPLKHLTKLNLGNNFISVLTGISQQNLPKLKYLDLTNNIISNLQPMGSLCVIQEFYCSHNNIGTIMQIDNVKTWNTLRVIDLSNNPINKDAVYKRFIASHLNNVKYISGDYVQNSDVIKTWTTEDVLGKSILNSMHKAEQLRNITQLTIVNCSLTKVDLSDDFLPHLESLDLSKNQIIQIEGLHSFQYLHTLCLSYNCIEIFETRHEANACFFPNLYTLFLDHNKLKSLMILAAKKLPVIKQLFLSYNNLNNVNEMCQYQTLESLILDYNEIETLNGTDFHRDNNINFLSLENNRIKSLLFAKSLEKLQKLYVANNYIINETELTFLVSLKNLEEFTFTGNPLHTEINDLDIVIQNFELINTGC